MDKIIIKYKQFLIGSLVTTILFYSYIYGLNGFLNIIFIPILISVIFLLYNEKRSRDIYFRDELSKINKYLDFEYYTDNECYEGCKVYYDIRDFIEKFKCDNTLNRVDNEKYNLILIFFKVYGKDIKNYSPITNNKTININDINTFKIKLAEIKNYDRS